MKRTSKERSAPMETLPPEIKILLREIEKEPVPERLLQLALQLQEALARRSRGEEAVGTAAQTSARPKQKVLR
ncbi:hypothetical protein NYR54_17630 [Chelativorans sp. SCAU2101]|uniref:Uncharacterized protein n=1 Tax=Chelativorans petroleitrophicus TaxID=2975484 RepID=A0A9X2XC28_9HYPH|nr:hypothetical protein [Chelativorans petroleitrophicus]MCT8992086.1 hypothetical protein [Chelativorans petroleitrophicus]